MKAFLEYWKAHNGKRALFGVLLIGIGVYGWITRTPESWTVILFGCGLLGLTAVDKG
jgi:hypothetical protein